MPGGAAYPEWEVIMPTVFVRWMTPLFAVVLVTASWARAEDDFERPPISYSATTPDNAIERLQRRLDGSR